MSYASEVAEGIKFLDLYAPSDWRSRIDLGRLNLSSTYHCIIGQIFGSFANNEAEKMKDNDRDTYYAIENAFCDNDYRGAWIEALEAPQVQSGTWYHKGTGAEFKLLSRYADMGTDMIVYRSVTNSIPLVRDYQGFLEFFTTEKPVKYVKGGLYTPEATSDKRILLFTDPGFMELGSGNLWSATTEHYEEHCGKLVPVKGVGGNSHGMGLYGTHLVVKH